MTISVLVVDDEPGLTTTLESTLRSGGYVVTAVDSGRRALEELSAQPFDVVLTDIMLPDIDGMQIMVWLLHRFHFDHDLRHEYHP